MATSVVSILVLSIYVDFKLVIFLVLIFLFLCYSTGLFSFVSRCLCRGRVSLHKSCLLDNYGKFSILPLAIDIFGMGLRTNESIFAHWAVD